MPNRTYELHRLTGEAISIKVNEENTRPFFVIFSPKADQVHPDFPIYSVLDTALDALASLKAPDVPPPTIIYPESD